MSYSGGSEVAVCFWGVAHGLEFIVVFETLHADHVACSFA